MLLVDLGTVLALAVVIVVAYLVVLWLALAFYVVRDARRRTTSPGFISFKVSAQCPSVMYVRELRPPIARFTTLIFLVSKYPTIGSPQPI